MIYEYKRGNGNEGDYFRFYVNLSEADCPFTALRALIVNDYASDRSVRRHIVKIIEIDGESEFGIYATVYGGPKGETEFGAAYITAQLNPIKGEDSESIYDFHNLRDILDNAVWCMYKAELIATNKRKGV